MPNSNSRNRILENGNLYLNEKEQIFADECKNHLSGYTYKISDTGTYLGKYVSSQNDTITFKGASSNSTPISIPSKTKVEATNVTKVKIFGGRTKKKKRNRKNKSSRRRR
jgi:hypothetical protein